MHANRLAHYIGPAAFDLEYFDRCRRNFLAWYYSQHKPDTMRKEWHRYVDQLQNLNYITTEQRIEWITLFNVRRR